MSELLLRDLHGHLQIVEQRRVHVAELMRRHASKTRGCRRRLQHIRSNFDSRKRIAIAIAEHEVVRRSGETRARGAR